jgi:hypothetical protein
MSTLPGIGLNSSLALVRDKSGVVNSVTTFILRGIRSASKIMRHRPAAGNSRVRIQCAPLTLVSLSAVVSAKLRIEFKRAKGT